MQTVRPLLGTDPKLFGRGRVRDLCVSIEPRENLFSDVKLFATTFVAGFLFVSILIG